jgi:hypothetical protein
VIRVEHDDCLQRIAWLEGEGPHSATVHARPAARPLPLFPAGAQVADAAE